MLLVGWGKLLTVLAKKDKGALYKMEELRKMMLLYVCGALLLYFTVQITIYRTIYRFSTKLLALPPGELSRSD